MTANIKAYAIVACIANSTPLTTSSIQLDGLDNARGRNDGSWIGYAEDDGATESNDGPFPNAEVGNSV